MLAISTAVAQDDFLDDLPKSGLIGDYRDSAGNSRQRVDSAMAFDWSSDSPDPHLAAGEFSVNWKGLLRVHSSGNYHFASDAVGAVSVTVDDATVFESDTRSQKWVAGREVDLRAGLHELTIRFQKRGSLASMRLFWSGPKFDWEPINPANTLHYSEDEPDGSRERGQSLVEALRCTACHEIPGSVATLDAPAIDRLTGNLNPDWLVERLMQTEPEHPGSSRMPHFGMTQSQSRAVTAYLFHLSAANKPKTLPKVNPPRKRGKDKTPTDPVQRGEQLFVSLGCLACHQKDQLAHIDSSSELLGGGALANVSSKRPAEFFRRWLSDPQAINRRHRMPTFQLSALESSDLARYLTSPDENRTGQAASGWLENDSLVNQGQRLVRDRQCAACHEIDASQRPETFSARVALGSQSKWETGCTSTHDAKRPFFRLNQDDQQAIEQYVLAAATGKQSADRVAGGQDLLRRSNCLACHKRGISSGNSATSMEVAKRYTSVIEHVSVLSPPSLNAIGDKFKDDALKQVIRGKADRRRDWLRIRMPKFRFSDQEVEQLANWFIHQDRVPVSRRQEREPLRDDVLLSVGPRLVTSNGFGCSSCHSIGKVSPAKSPINSRGPNLAGLGKQMRKEWFSRWVADPLRVVPRVEMPAITLPVKGVLDDNLEQQIDAVWHVLNLEGFRPPRPDPIRVVRHSGLDGSAWSHVMTDVLRVDEAQYIKPLLIGLPNRHNVLIDLAENRIAGWWLGDTAMLQNEGKTWYWEAGGTNLLGPPNSAPSDFSLVSNDSERPPLRHGQFLTELDGWEHTTRGLLVSHRLTFQQNASSAVTVHVKQRFAPAAREEGISGWTREISAEGIPDGWSLRIRAATGEFQTRDGELVSGDDAAMRVAIVRGTTPGRTGGGFESDGSILLSNTETIRFRYTTDLPSDTVPKVEIKTDPAKTVQLDVVPGFKATDLGLPADMLPTGFSWDSEGTLFLSDLLGRVYRAVDSDQDGLPDKANVFSDELAAPFGLKAHKGYVDVITKYALLRLHDADADGQAERVETLVSGWGHTADYHDWAIGLPQSDDGRYFLAFPCQQDDRTEAGAKLRGKVVQLLPRKPTANDPHHFKIEILTGGHRFPIGIARNRAGEMFVPDNQGNYNPFNELNHIVPGRRYGFINKLERRDGFNPPLTAPAIDIPHPWTRSVNGICFLETPAELGDSKFGPFEGHLLGCEYDTRRLIRLSLQHVGDTIQGAAYPLSYDEPPTGPPLLGPLSCAVSPQGAIYIGNLRESGWGAGQNTGTVVRLEMDPKNLPVGIAEVRALANGFSIRFTAEVSAELAQDPANYSIQSYTRKSTPEYGGDDMGNRSEAIKSVRYDASERRVMIELDDLRQGFVYEFNLKRMIADKGALFFPERAFYTLRTIPE